LIVNARRGTATEKKTICSASEDVEVVASDQDDEESERRLSSIGPGGHRWSSIIVHIVSSAIVLGSCESAPACRDYRPLSLAMATSDGFALPSVPDHEVVDLHTDSAGTFLACTLDGTVAV
jgi:hypothetical protein